MADGRDHEPPKDLDVDPLFLTRSAREPLMVDTVDQATRSRIMARIRSRDTGPELTLRRALHARGLRYRPHNRKLPGSPDLVFRRFRAACFVHGCFWHRHDSCALTTTPSSRVDYWQAKFQANVSRDKRNVTALLESGWRVAVVWKCALCKNSQTATIKSVEDWLRGTAPWFETAPRRTVPERT